MTPVASQREVITLDNGARIVFDPMPGLATASVGVWLGAGARHERAERSGLAHFLEHMAFKMAGGRNAREIAEAVEARGAALNASTEYERTTYYVRALAEDAPGMLEIALALPFAPEHPPADIDRERNVVLQEIGEAADQPDDLVHELAQTASFGDHPLGRPILGREETLMSVTRDDLFAFAAETYAPQRTVVSVAGAFDRGAVEAAARRWLEKRPRFAVAASEPPAAPTPQALSDEGDLEQTHLMLCRPGPHARSEDRFAARVFSEIFGGGMASRLFQEVREDRGLAYTIDAQADQYTDAGRISVYAGCAPGDADEVVRIVSGVWNDLAANGPTDAELRRAKAVARAGYAMSAESPAARAGSAAYELLTFDRLVHMEEVMERIEAVTTADVARIARACLAGPATAASVGPSKGIRAAERFVAG